MTDELKTDAIEDVLLDEEVGRATRGRACTQYAALVAEVDRLRAQLAAKSQDALPAAGLPSIVVEKLTLEKCASTQFCLSAVRNRGFTQHYFEVLDTEEYVRWDAAVGSFVPESQLMAMRQRAEAAESVRDNWRKKAEKGWHDDHAAWVHVAVVERDRANAAEAVCHDLKQWYRMPGATLAALWQIIERARAIANGSPTEPSTPRLRGRGDDKAKT